MSRFNTPLAGFDFPVPNTVPTSLANPPGMPSPLSNSGYDRRRGGGDDAVGAGILAAGQGLAAGITARGENRFRGKQLDLLTKQTDAAVTASNAQAKLYEAQVRQADAAIADSEFRQAATLLDRQTAAIMDVARFTNESENARILRRQEGTALAIDAYTVLRNLAREDQALTRRAESDVFLSQADLAKKLAEAKAPHANAIWAKAQLQIAANATSKNADVERATYAGQGVLTGSQLWNAYVGGVDPIDGTKEEGDAYRRAVVAKFLPEGAKGVLDRGKLEGFLTDPGIREKLEAPREGTLAEIGLGKESIVPLHHAYKRAKWKGAVLGRSVSELADLEGDVDADTLTREINRPFATALATRAQEERIKLGATLKGVIPNLPDKVDPTWVRNVDEVVRQLTGNQSVPIETGALSTLATGAKRVAGAIAAGEPMNMNKVVAAPKGVEFNAAALSQGAEWQLKKWVQLAALEVGLPRMTDEQLRQGPGEITDADPTMAGILNFARHVLKERGAEVGEAIASDASRVAAHPMVREQIAGDFIATERRDPAQQKVLQDLISQYPDENPAAVGEAYRFFTKAMNYGSADPRLKVAIKGMIRQNPVFYSAYAVDSNEKLAEFDNEVSELMSQYQDDPTSPEARRAGREMKAKLERAMIVKNLGTIDDNVDRQVVVEAMKHPDGLQALGEDWLNDYYHNPYLLVNGSMYGPAFAEERENEAAERAIVDQFKGFQQELFKTGADQVRANAPVDFSTLLNRVGELGSLPDVDFDKHPRLKALRDISQWKTRMLTEAFSGYIGGGMEAAGGGDEAAPPQPLPTLQGGNGTPAPRSSSQQQPRPQSAMQPANVLAQ